jgi:predicted GNAT family acetyltransferase
LRIAEVESKSLLRACRRFLGQDPVANVLPLGDLYPPLLQVSNIHSAIENSKVVGVCAIYRAFSAPSLVLGTATKKIKRALLKKAIEEVSGTFTSLCPPEDTCLFKDHATVLRSHLEQQMIANPPKKAEDGEIKAEKVGKRDLGLLDKFYVEHNAEAWTRLQFRVGPYYCVKHNGEIVSAAGVHLVAPQIAQLGNIITNETHRNRGLATACTGALATELASEKRIISLFVRKNNAPAIRMYEKLAFRRAGEITFLFMQKRNILQHSKNDRRVKE